MKLYIDQGNTRIKLWLIEAGRLQIEAYCRDAEDLAGWLSGQAAEAMDVRVASVAGDQADAALTEALRPRARSLAFARVDTARLPTAYAEPARLGVDRWLAVLAATTEAGPAIIVDAGTAFTVDALSEGGMHLGGYILPGLSLQREALAARTARVAFPEPDWSGLDWGESTSSAVCRGSLQALVALVGAAQARLRQASGGEPRVLLTGGDAALIAAHLVAELHPMLVLEGLAVYFNDAETRRLARAGGKV